MAKPVLLTVDDDSEVLNAIKRDLQKHYTKDYRVLYADSGATGLQTLRGLKKRNDAVGLLLADQRMPEMTGVEFISRAMELFPDARRVLLTAYADTDAAIQAINDAKIHHYLLKPWDPPEERLYPVLDRIRRARVMLFFFKDDIYDPGGRGARSEEILSARPRIHLVVDRPVGLETHWAGSSGTFAARFGSCIVAFAGSGRDIPPACNGTSTDRPALTAGWSASHQTGKSDATPPLSGGSAAR